jgi:hypothetical protein
VTALLGRSSHENVFYQVRKQNQNRRYLALKRADVPTRPGHMGGPRGGTGRGIACFIAADRTRGFNNPAKVGSESTRQEEVTNLLAKAQLQGELIVVRGTLVESTRGISMGPEKIKPPACHSSRIPPVLPLPAFVQYWIGPQTEQPRHRGYRKSLVFCCYS